MNKIIAIVGMCGSGKSIANDFFVKKGFKSIYFGGVTIDKLKEKNLEINEQNEKMMRESLRKEYGMGAYAVVLLPKIEEYLKDGNVILDGLYSWDEYKILKDKFNDNLIVLSIIVDKNIRYERLKVRNIRPLTNIEAESRDISEIENLQKGGPISFADYYVFNNGNIEEYYENLEKVTNLTIE